MMSSNNKPGQHVQDNSVAERRLRPIYDWLDNGNNKKALQECEKVLKKTPHLHCAKALKALTLHRMGKETESIAILDVLAAERPVDDATLQAMTLCYRELQQLDSVCRLYETAVKLDPTNEELHTHLFMAYVRTFDYRSQQKTAMHLYKFKAKNPYYCWAVMSVILQATRGDGRTDPTKRTLLLSLAERMMVKLIADQKIDAEQEVQLYMMILELEGKYEEILALLRGPLATKLISNDLHFYQLKYLIKLERWHDVNLLCKSVLSDSVDKWDIWKTYINSVIKLMSSNQILNNHHTTITDNPDTNKHIVVPDDNVVPIDTNNTKSCYNEVINDDDDGATAVDDTPEKCHEFICTIIEEATVDNGFSLRGPYLARIELCSQLIRRRHHHQNNDYNTMHDLLGDPVELFIEYFRKFGHKPCCVTDLKIYLNLLKSEQKGELASRLIKDVGISSTSVPQSEYQMQRHLCALQISRLCGNHRNLSCDHLKALVTAFSLHYQHGYQTYGINQTLPTTHLGPADSYALLACHVIYDLSQLANQSDSILLALVLLETLLKNSPSNFHAKLLCIRLYHTVGGGLGARNWYNSLDCKHLQLDSLGYIHCERLPTTGLLSLCSDLFDVTLKFFSTNYKDSSDHLTFSYKYGSFLKLDEFMDFRERLNNSLHYTMTAVDRIVLTLIECPNLDGLYSMNISPKDDQIDWDSLRDNQDLSVYLNWDPDSLECELNESHPDVRLLFEQNIDFLKMRTSILWAMSASINICKSSTNNRDDYIVELKTILNDLDQLYRDICAKNYQPHNQQRIALPLPSRIHVFLRRNLYVEIVSNFFRFFLSIVLDDSPDIIEQLMESNENALTKLLDDVDGDKNETKINNEELLVVRREHMEFIVNSVEILCISSLVCTLCHQLIKTTTMASSQGSNNSISSSKKGKKRVTSEPPNARNTLLNDVVLMLQRQLTRLCAIIDHRYNVVVELNDLSSVKLDLLNLTSDISTVKDNIIGSYLLAYRELQNVLKIKVKLLNSLNNYC